MPPAPALAELPPAIRKPGRPPKPKPARNLSKRTRAALELMVFGAPDGPTAGIALSRAEAAAAVGITDSALYQALRNPVARKLLAEHQQVLRDSLKPKALARIGSLIDVADSDKVRLDAARWIDGDGHERKSAAVNVNVGVGVNIQPGYQVRIGDEFADVVDLQPDTRSGADGG